LEDGRIPKEDDPHRHISYYQWVAVFLIFQSVLFYLPRLLWKSLSTKSGIAVHTIVDTAIERQKKTDKDSADRTMEYLVKKMGRFLLELHQNASNTTSRLHRYWLAVYGNYLIALYLFIKLLYIANIICQIFMINAFLGSTHMDSGYHMYGFEVMERLVKGENWTTSVRFPRVTICDFKILTVGNLNRHTVQCTLPLNLLNEIFFIFIWFWFMMVGLSTCISFLIWIFTSLSHKSQVRFIRNRLVAIDKYKTKYGKGKKKDKDKFNDTNGTRINCELELIDNFVSDFLLRDGCFIVRLVAENTSDHIASELIAGLWKHYKSNRKNFSKRMPEIEVSENQASTGLMTSVGSMNEEIDHVEKHL